jgi:uncharacterized protein YjbI with pentapeptide repeats
LSYTFVWKHVWAPGIIAVKGEAMANQEQLEILKQGDEVWNKWREENPDIVIDLSGVDLRGTTLRKMNLRGANLTGTKLSNVKISSAMLIEANLSFTRLDSANLSNANLIEATFFKTKLTGTNFYNVELGRTKIISSDLSEVMDLEFIKHFGPSYLSIDTIQKFKGKFPLQFLRGCGLSDWEIESAKLYNPGLNNLEVDEILYKVHDLRATRPLQISPLFISYSHADSPFVDKIEEQLNDNGIRFWRDMRHATAGRLEKQIDQAIRYNPTIMLVLSSNSIKSDWVEHEVRTARELEKELGRDTLCPVALDDSWKSSSWPKRVMEQVMEYNILDFSEWEDNSKFEGMFRRLIDGLELFYKG